MSDLAKIGRRDLIAGAAATAGLALTGCRSDDAHARATIKTLAEVSRAAGARYVDSNGKPVNVDALVQSLKGQPSTLSFMFAACGDVCPTVGLALNMLSEHAPRLKHVVISVDPAGDFANSTLKDKLEAQGLKTGIGGNTMILYPTADGTTSDIALLNGQPMAQRVQNKLNLIINPNGPEGHSGAVTLFGADGNLRKQVFDVSKIVETLKPEIDASRGR